MTPRSKKTFALLCLALAALAGGLSGCLRPNLHKLAAALAKDSATVNVSVQTVYGTLKFIRTNPGSNSTVTVTPDGTVTVRRE